MWNIYIFCAWSIEQSVGFGSAFDRPRFAPSGSFRDQIARERLQEPVAQGPALLAMTDGQVYAPTIGFNIAFIKAAKPGAFVGKGRVVSLGKTIVFTEAELFDEAGDLIARATFSSRAMRSETASVPV